MKNILVSAAFLLMAGTGFGQVTPYNSWRALIVYTNATDSVHGSILPAGVDMYTGYFASLFDGLNDTYEDSYIGARAQIAGVIWNKTYSRTGCDLGFGNGTGANALARYTALLERYAADVIILVNHDTGDIGGCAYSYEGARGLRYAGFWVYTPDNLQLFAHEMGHLHSTAGNADHCTGHRMTFDASGNVMAGPLPDYIPMMNIVDSAGKEDVGHYVMESTPWTVHHGFHTTMAYGKGGSQYCWSTFGPHLHGGVTRTFKIYHQGTHGVQTEWTGTFSHPSGTWEDTLTHTFYPTGFDSVTYMNRYKYVGDAFVTQLSDTTYNRNFSAIHDANADTIRNLKGVPLTVTISPKMGVGPNASDTQWVYSHIAAQTSVIVQPGFVFNGGHLKVSVGGPGASLPKRAAARQMTDGRQIALPDSKVAIKYDPSRQVVEFMITQDDVVSSDVSIFNSRGKRVWSGKVTSRTGQGLAGNVSVRDLVKGVYVVRVEVGKNYSHRRFAKF